MASPLKVDKSPQNVGPMRGDILHKYNVGLPGESPDFILRLESVGG